MATVCPACKHNFGLFGPLAGETFETAAPWWKRGRFPATCFCPVCGVRLKAKIASPLGYIILVALVLLPLGIVRGIPVAESQGWLPHSEVRIAWMLGMWLSPILIVAYAFVGRFFVVANAP
jgi:hypothetical protein